MVQPKGDDDSIMTPQNAMLRPEEDSWHWRIGKARLEYVDTQRQRLVWVTRDGLKRNLDNLVVSKKSFIHHNHHS